MNEQETRSDEAEQHLPGHISSGEKLRAWLRSPAMWALVLGTVLSIGGLIVFSVYAAQREPGGAREPLDGRTTGQQP